MARLFFSYSHRDEAFRDELEVHLAQLKHEGIVETWHDRRIPAGDVFENEISEHLEFADIILLLISPYFLASNYCRNIELKRALERHASNEARVIPVILEPCDWHTAPFAKLQMATKDAKPISKYPNQHDAYLEVAQAIRAIAGSVPSQNSLSADDNPKTQKSKTKVVDEIRSSNLRIKKEFTDQDRVEFLDKTFEYISNYFEGSLGELEKRNPGIGSRFRRVNANHFTAEIYRNGSAIASCGIRLATFFRNSQIAFSDDPNATNSMNESVDVCDDGYMMYLRASGMSLVFARQSERDSKLSPEGAAELFWSLLIRPLQQ